MGDHSTMYFSTYLSSPVQVSPPAAHLSFPLPSPLPLRSHLVQNYLRLLMSYTALPGFYGTDEEESELTLGFWYLFQEALWNVEYDIEHGGQDSGPEFDEEEQKQKARVDTAKAVYSELVQILRRKVTWPGSELLKSWTRGETRTFFIEFLSFLPFFVYSCAPPLIIDQRDKFQQYALLIAWRYFGRLQQRQLL